MTRACEVGLSPEQFWRLTPWEFARAVEGYEARHSSLLEALAWTQANLMNMWVAKGPKVRASQLYRRPNSDEAPEFLDSESFTEYMRAKEERGG